MKSKDKWPTKKLGDVLVLCDAGTWGDEDSDGLPLLRSTNMQNGKLILDDLKTIAVPTDKIEQYTLREGDILMTKSSGSVDHIGKSLFITAKMDGLYGFSNFTQRLRVDQEQAIPKWVYLKVSDPATRSFLLDASQTTTGLRNLKISRLKELEIPLPPLAEQKKIVERIEKQFAKIDEAIYLREQSLAATDALLPATLHEIFEEGKQKGWMHVDLGKVLKLQGGFAFKSNDYCSGGVPLVRIQNLQDDVLDISKVAYLPASFSKDFERFLLSDGDILIAMSGATTGKLARVSQGFLPALLNQRVGRFLIISDDLEKDYLWFFLKAVQSKILTDAYGAAQPNISPTKIESIKIPLPPLAEQKRIVKKLDTLSAQIRTLRTMETSQLANLKSLKQSILHEVFAG